MIGKIIMLNARNEYKEKYNEFRKSQLSDITDKLKNRTDAPVHPVSPKNSNGQQVFKSNVQQKVESMIKTGEYKDYLAKTDEDTITA